MSAAAFDYMTYKMLGRNGRLGNQMFQVAGMIRKEITGEGDLALGPNWKYRRCFSVADDYFRLLSRQELRQATDSGPEYFQSISQIPTREACQRLFTLSDEMEEQLQIRYGDYLVLAPTALAVHVRRGDYLEHSDRFVNLGADYYNAAMDVLHGEGRRFTHTLLFSDDLEGASQIGINADLKAVRPRSLQEGEFDDVLQMALMSRCAGIVIANSTYSWWSAFLSNEDSVVFPIRWGHDASFADRANELYVDRWRLVGCTFI